MKTPWSPLILTCLSFLSPRLASAVIKRDNSEVQSTIQYSTAALHRLMATAETSIPRKLIQDASCVASIHILKVGFIWGIHVGRGVVSCRSPTGTWDAPLFVDLASLSWGPQVGLEVMDLVLVFTGHSAKERFAAGNVSLSAEGGLTVGPLGREISRRTNFAIYDAAYSYFQSQGVFIGISLEGSFLMPDRQLNQDAYGERTLQQTLDDSKDSSPVNVHPYMNALALCSDY